MLRFLRRAKRYFIIGSVCSVVFTMLEMLNPQIIKFVIDGVIGGSESGGGIAGLVSAALGGAENVRENMLLIVAAVALVSLASITVSYAVTMFNSIGSEIFVKNMRDGLYAHIERLPFSWHMSANTGETLQRCTSDVDMVKRFMSEQLTNMLRIILLVALSLWFMAGMNIKLTIIAAISVPIVVVYSVFFHRSISARFNEADVNEGKLSGVVQENLTGVRVVRAYGRERYEADKFEKFNKTYADSLNLACRIMAFFWVSADLIQGLAIMAVIAAGSFMCVNGELTPGGFIAFISYNSMLVWPVRMLGRIIANLSRAKVAVTRVAAIMNEPAESDRPDASRPDMTGKISFENVSFSYDNAEQILDNVSFDIEPGETLGILGGTGSGKSTLMLLLTRLYELGEGQGRITVGGVDLRDISLKHLRSNIGIVLQEPFLFSRTIKENIGITTAAEDDSSIREAARIACIDNTIEGFEDGYNTMVGERGVTLSGGQKQRAAIARMLAKKTPVIVFDDSLSAVDTATNAKIRAELTGAMGNATVILISHRITTLAKADRIVVLDRGRVVQCGTPVELEKQDGIYARVCAIQSADSGEVTA